MRPCDPRFLSLQNQGDARCERLRRSSGRRRAACHHSAPRAPAPHEHLIRGDQRPCVEVREQYRTHVQANLTTLSPAPPPPPPLLPLSAEASVIRETPNQS